MKEVLEFAIEVSQGVVEDFVQIIDAHFDLINWFGTDAPDRIGTPEEIDRTLQIALPAETLTRSHQMFDVVSC